MFAGDDPDMYNQPSSPVLYTFPKSQHFGNEPKNNTAFSAGHAMQTTLWNTAAKELDVHTSTNVTTMAVMATIQLQDADDR